MEQDTNRSSFRSRAPGIIPECDLPDRQRIRQNSLSHGTSSSVPAELSQVKTEEVENTKLLVYFNIRFPPLNSFDVGKLLYYAG